MPGILTNLKIIGYPDMDMLPFTPPLVFECMFNPDTYSTDHKIEYNTRKTAGPIKRKPAYNNNSHEQFSIEFTIDGTGVSSDLEIPVPVPVPEQVLLFNAVTINIVGATHRPNNLIVQWGTFIRSCVLVTSKITYTLFDSAGIPLRAKINATFLENESEEFNRIAGMISSPDLTHQKVVQESDILPLMVYIEYKNQDYYLQVARFNKLKNFRKLETGSIINFPPIS